jgi:hypothetical protein
MARESCAFSATALLEKIDDPRHIPMDPVVDAPREQAAAACRGPNASLYSLLDAQSLRIPHLRSCSNLQSWFLGGDDCLALR